MPFIKADVDKDIKKRSEKDKEFREAYNQVSKEYELKKELIKRRKDQNITQSAIARKTGLKQQEISRVETESNSPTLRTFLKYLDAMNLELKIVEKPKNDKVKVNKTASV